MSLATAGLVWVVARSPVAPRRVSRLEITTPSGAALGIGGAVTRDLAVSPDGSRLIYIGANRGVFVRPFDQLDATPLVRTATARDPFVSPDGQWVGFADENTTLKKVPITGGPALPVAKLNNNSRGATWAPDDTIIVAVAGGGLQRVSATGGEPVVLTRPDPSRGEASHEWPEILPGGQAVLFTIRSTTGGLDAASIAVLDLRTGRKTVLLRGGSDAHYVSSGHVVYAAAGALRAVGFDLARLTIVGTPTPVVPQVLMTTLGAAEAVLARDGTLVYVSGSVGTGAERTLVWVDRQGGETAIGAPVRAYMHPRISPDGTRVAVSAFDQQLDIWLWSLPGGPLTPVTFDPGFDAFPVWTPHSDRLLFASNRGGPRNLFTVAADGTGTVEPLTESPNRQTASAITPDGRRLVFSEQFPETGEDIMAVEVEGQHQITPVLKTVNDERDGMVSPDGRWLAYEANDSGPFEIYVRPYPNVNSGQQRQVSTGGGMQPLWAHSGRELFYRAPDGALMRVAVASGSTWTATTPTKLLGGQYWTLTGGTFARTYDIAPDDQRFLMIKAGGSDATGAAPHIVVVQHFDEELKRLVPTK
jgi:Tol biopolymer transport system component